MPEPSNKEKAIIEGPVNKKQKILEKIVYDDLEDKESDTNGKIHLNLSKVAIYLYDDCCNVFFLCFPDFSEILVRLVGKKIPFKRFRIKNTPINMICFNKMF